MTSINMFFGKRNTRGLFSLIAFLAELFYSISTADAQLFACRASDARNTIEFAISEDGQVRIRVLQSKENEVRVVKECFPHLRDLYLSNRMESSGWGTFRISLAQCNSSPPLWEGEIPLLNKLTLSLHLSEAVGLGGHEGAFGQWRHEDNDSTADLQWSKFHGGAPCQITVFNAPLLSEKYRQWTAGTWGR